MDLLSLIVGVFLGAAFSPFWMKVWAWLKGLIQSKTDTTEK